MKTQKQALQWINSKIGTGIDWDNSYGFQCMDEAVAYLYYVTDGKIAMWGNAIDAIKNDFKGLAEVIVNKPSTVPKAGDIVVWTTGNFSVYGHIAVVTNGNPGGDLMSIEVVEQNWNGNGLYKTEFATKRVHDYTGISHFIRPKFAPETTTKTVEKAKVEPTKKVETKSTKQPKKLVYIQDEIRGYNMTKRGHNPKGVVLHNDAGAIGATAQAYHNGLVNANYDRLARGVAHSYISGNTVYQAIPENKIAWHVADGINPGSGNYEYYGIEICQSIGADDKTFLSNEQSAFQEAARLLTKWGLPANRNTVRLHREFSQTICPHRSTAIHCGVDPQYHAINETQLLQVKDYFIQQIRQYMDGKVPESTVVKNAPVVTKPNNTVSKNTGSNIGKKFNFNGLTTNDYGTRWYYEDNSFTCNARQGIITRVGSPFTSAPQAGTLFYGQTVTYNQVAVNNKEPYVWISWITYDGTEVWMPVEVLDKNNVITEQWGTFAW